MKIQSLTILRKVHIFNRHDLACFFVPGFVHGAESSFSEELLLFVLIHHLGVVERSSVEIVVQHLLVGEEFEIVVLELQTFLCVDFRLARPLEVQVFRDQVHQIADFRDVLTVNPQNTFFVSSILLDDQLRNEGNYFS